MVWRPRRPPGDTGPVTTPHGHDSGLGPEEVDARFADIVAGFATPSTDPVPRWSTYEDADDAPVEEPVAPDLPRPPLSSRLMRSRPVDPAPENESPVDPLDIEEHYVPDPPPPLPSADRATRLAWAAMVGGPALLVLAALLGIGLETWIVVLALCAFLGGFAALIARMRDHHDDDGNDDGPQADQRPVHGARSGTRWRLGDGLAQAIVSPASRSASAKGAARPIVNGPKMP